MEKPEVWRQARTLCIRARDGELTEVESTTTSSGIVVKQYRVA